MSCCVSAAPDTNSLACCVQGLPCCVPPAGGFSPSQFETASSEGLSAASACCDSLLTEQTTDNKIKAYNCWLTFKTFYYVLCCVLILGVSTNNFHEMTIQMTLKWIWWYNSFKNHLFISIVLHFASIKEDEETELDIWTRHFYQPKSGLCQCPDIWKSNILHFFRRLPKLKLCIQLYRYGLGNQLPTLKSELERQWCWKMKSFEPVEYTVNSWRNYKYLLLYLLSLMGGVP